MGLKHFYFWAMDWNWNWGWIVSIWEMHPVVAHREYIWTRYSAVILWFLFFLGVHILSSILSPIFFPKILKKTNKKARSRFIRWNVEVVSLLHSIMICALAIPIYILMKIYPEHEWFKEIVADPLYGYSEKAMFVVAIAAGYFIWDFLVCVIYYRIFRFQGLFHALFSMVSFVLVCITEMFIYYGLIFLIFEVSTPFLNIRSLLNKADKGESKAYYINSILFVFTFFLSRVAFGLYQQFHCSVKIIHNVENLSPFVVVWYFLASMSSTLINMYWFVLIVMKMVELFLPSKPKTS